MEEKITTILYVLVLCVLAYLLGYLRSINKFRHPIESKTISKNEANDRLCGTQMPCQHKTSKHECAYLGNCDYERPHKRS